ncbi:acyl carrier protein [Actinomadura sp. DC4]|uniref:acyl carrier protein n=1 Tax=Actinomadura sp. DC4 TaxID=3055069 RepID=UPI0025AFB99C|nr:acyl carrier protein [Actinomadura sp. DC4]MDN3352241.1 acyl carrier protein [Actinomadura sp. DC4]
MTSQTAVELRDRLGAATGLRLSPSAVFDHPTRGRVALRAYGGGRAESAVSRRVTMVAAEPATRQVTKPFPVPKTATPAAAPIWREVLNAADAAPCGAGSTAATAHEVMVVTSSPETNPRGDERERRRPERT